MKTTGPQTPRPSTQAAKAGIFSPTARPRSTSPTSAATPSAIRPTGRRRLFGSASDGTASAGIRVAFSTGGAHVLRSVHRDQVVRRAAVIRVDRREHLKVARPAVERDQAEPELSLRAALEEVAP